MKILSLFREGKNKPGFVHLFGSSVKTFIRFVPDVYMSLPNSIFLFGGRFPMLFQQPMSAISTICTGFFFSQFVKVFYKGPSS